MMNRRDIVDGEPRARRKRVLTRQAGMSDEHPRYSPDGRYCVYHAYDTERAFNDQGHLRAARAPDAARCTQLAPRFDRATHARAVDARLARAPVPVEDRGRIGPVAAALDAATPVRLGRAGGTIGGFARSRDGGVIAFERVSAMHPPALFACARRRQRRARDRDAQRRAARAPCVRRRARVHGQGLGRRARADVRHLSAELRSERRSGR